MPFPAGLVQPDQTTCGPAVAVTARMLLEPAYRAWVAQGTPPASRFVHEVASTHARLASWLGPDGRPQLPWPRALGTAPWALARLLTAHGAQPRSSYGVRPVWPTRRGRSRAFDRLVATLVAGAPAPLFVGNSRSPRHVVLVVGAEPGRLRCYDPARGRPVDVLRSAFVDGPLKVSGWAVPWLVVVPVRTGRRTTA
ncbi:hypothetical protein [Nocardioides pacificus]